MSANEDAALALLAVNDDDYLEILGETVYDTMVAGDTDFTAMGKKLQAVITSARASEAPEKALEMVDEALRAVTGNGLAATAELVAEWMEGR